MKKNIFLLAISIFAISSVFAQTYVVSADWPQEECNCFDQGNSYYGVKVVIYDAANDVTVIAGKQVNVDFGTYSVEIPVPEVNNHCEDQSLPLAPHYTVWVDVAVFCDMFTPPQAICNTEIKSLSNRTCADFANGLVDFSFIGFQ